MNDSEKITSLIGNNLIIIQKIEAFLKAVLLISPKCGDIDSKLNKLLQLDKQTLGRLVNLLNEQIVLPPDFSITIIDFLNMRNVFVHKLFMQDWFNLNTEEGLKRIDIFLNDLLSKSKKVLKIFAAVAMQLGNPKQVGKDLNLFDKILERIYLSSVSDFGKKCFKVYLELFTKELDQQYLNKIVAKK